MSKQKILPAVMAVVLAVGTCPAVALADEGALAAGSASGVVAAAGGASGGTEAAALSAQAADGAYDNVFAFGDAGITATGSGSGYSVDGTALTITSAGTYYLSGSCANGSVTVKKNTTGVTLVLADGFSLGNSGDTAPITCNGSTQVTVYAEGTATLADTGAAGDAGIKAKSGSALVVAGASGSTLNVSSTAKNGIKGAAGAAVIIGESADDGFTLNVTATAKNGIASDGSVEVKGGTVNVEANDGIKSAPEADAEDKGASAGTIAISGGTVTIVSSDEGIVAEPDAGNTTAAGAIAITGGTINVTSGSDSIRAAGDVDITGGAFTLRSQADGIQTDADLAISGGTFDVKTMGGYADASFDKDTMSAKGLKARYETDDDAAAEDATNTLTITGGTFTLDTADDAIHCDNDIDIAGGTFDIKTGDDAVHADSSLWLGEEGAVDANLKMAVSSCYEGLEGGNVFVYSGTYSIHASDDGVNAAGGSDSSDQPEWGGFIPGGGGRPGPGGMGPGGMGPGGSSSTGNYSVNISGGTIEIAAKGDGIDSNGALNISGGTVVSFSQGGSENGLDADGTFRLTGGTVFAVGGNSPAAATPASGGQAYKGWTRIGSAIASGRTVTLTSDGATLVSLAAPLAVQSNSYWFYSSPEISSSSNCTFATSSATPTGEPLNGTTGSADGDGESAGGGSSSTGGSGSSSSPSAGADSDSSSGSSDAGSGAATLVSLAGERWYDTMEQVVSAGDWGTGGIVVLATAQSYHDGLTAAGAAGLTGSPVIMTDKDSLTSSAASLLAELGPSRIIVAGGPEAVSESTVSQAAAAAGIPAGSVIRMYGERADDTACELFKQAAEVTGESWSTTAFVCTDSSFHDALAAAPISYAQRIPVFLTRNGGTEISQATLAAMKAGGITDVYLVGGTAAVSGDVESQLRSYGFNVVDRLWGERAVETSVKVADLGVDVYGMSADKMGVSTNGDYYDALCGAALCGANGSVMVLVDNAANSSIPDFIAKRAAGISEVEVFGGTAAVSQATRDAIVAATRTGA